VSDRRRKIDIEERSRPYGPRGGAEKLFYCRDEEILLEGPAGTGKTSGALEKANLCLMKYPGSRVLAVRKTRTSMTESVLVTFEEKVLPAGSHMAKGQQRRLRSAYQYPNGSTLVIGGMDNADRIMSTEFDMVIAFEALELVEDDWEKLTTRLRNGKMPYQQAIADVNPGPPTHWLNRRAQASGMTRILSRHEDNPILHNGNTWTERGLLYLKKLQRLTGARKDRLYGGRWVSAEGVVYEGFNPSVHFVDRDKLPRGWENWRRFRSVDFGFQNPFVAQEWLVDPDGTMYLFREIYKTRTLVEDHARKLIELAGPRARYEANVCDHDAEDRATLDRHGVPTIAAKKSISPGLQAVAQRLAVDPVTKKPRIYFVRDALVERDEALADASMPTSTPEEFDSYLWPKGADGKTIKEVPIDANNHGMDAMRYAVMYLDGGSLRAWTGEDIDKVLYNPGTSRTTEATIEEVEKRILNIAKLRSGMRK
jgi:PBSX family phage terminase large subunit